VAGQNSLKKNTIQAGTFKVTADYKLTPADSKTFDMKNAIKVLRIDTRP